MGLSIAYINTGLINQKFVVKIHNKVSLSRSQNVYHIDRYLLLYIKYTRINIKNLF